MSEPVMPAPSDPDPHDGDPFNDFVNDELDLSPLGEDDPRRRPLNFLELPSLLSERGLFSRPDHDQGDFFGEIDLDKWEKLGDDQAVADYFEAQLREYLRDLHLLDDAKEEPMPFPEPDDARWIDGIYRTEIGFRVYTQPDILSNLVVFNRSSWHWNRRVRYIQEIVPGWAAVEFNLSRPLRGYVRLSDVKLRPGTGFMPNLASWLHEGTNLIGVFEIVIIIILAIFLLNASNNRDADVSQLGETLQMTLSAQNERIANLEATLSFVFPGE